MTKPQALSPLAVFIENEEKVAQLYDIYAQTFSAQRKMWALLAKEEGRHAKVLRDLENKLAVNEQFATVRVHGWKILLYVSDFIDEQLAMAQAGKIKAKEAIEVGLSLERSMIEKKSFDVFLPLHAEMKGALEKLNRETDGHALRLEKALATLT